MKKFLLGIMLLSLVGCHNEQITPQNPGEVVNVALNEENGNNNDQQISEVPPQENENGYTLLGSMNDGTEIYYKLDEPYKSRQICSEIIAKSNNDTTVLSDLPSSVPVMNDTLSQVAFVQNVGFESFGKLYLYDGQIYQLTSNALKEKESNSRTLKDCTWFGDELLVILGFDSGTITEGGDVYLININTGDLRMVMDAKDNVEVVNIDYEEDTLNYELLYWLDDNYQETLYEDKSLFLKTYMSQLPILIERPNLNVEITEVSIFSKDELEGFDWYQPDLMLSDFKENENLGDEAFPSYKKGYMEYTFTMFADEIWTLTIKDINVGLPRNIKIGDAMKDVIQRFNPEVEVTDQTQIMLYGKETNDIETQKPMAVLYQNSGGSELIVTTENYSPVLIFNFENNQLKSFKVNYYIAN
ncbi:MAG: DUF4652 domain-containing protein [Clostridia bacterium]|nr:DUF4652 domain-containing protein [Clostridia bacterium]